MQLWNHFIIFIILLALSACGSLDILPKDKDDTYSVPITITPVGQKAPVTAQLLLTFRSDYPTDIITADHHLSIPIDIQPAINCFWRKIDQRRLACERKNKTWLKPGTKYKVVIPSGWKDSDGNQIKSTIVHEFTTITPEVRSANIKEYLAPTEPVIKVRFNIPVDADAIIDFLYISDVDGQRYPVKKREIFQDKWHVLISSKIPLPVQDGFELMVTEGLRGKKDRKTHLEIKSILEFNTFGDFYFKGVHCKTGHAEKEAVEYISGSHQACKPDTIRLLFSSIVNDEEFHRHLIIKQDGKDVYVGKHYGYARLLSWARLPKLKYGEEYDIKLNAGELKDKFGKGLLTDVNLRIKTLDFPPTILDHPREIVLEQDINSDLAIETINIEEDIWIAFDKDKETLTKTISADKNQNNKRQRLPLGLRQQIGSQGWLTGTIYSPEFDRHSQSSEFFAQVTPFNIHWQGTKKRSLFWVSRLADAQPVVDATVELYQGKINQPDRSKLLMTAKTDAEGLAFIQHEQLDIDEKSKDFFVKVSQGKEQGWLIINNRNTHCWYYKNLFAQKSMEDTLVFAVSSQPFYQPGELVQLKLFNRIVSSGHIEKFPVGEYNVVFTDAMENPIPGLNPMPITWSEFGTAAIEFRIPEKFSGGNYIELTMAGGQVTEYVTEIRVASFNKSTFQVSSSLQADESSDLPANKIVLQSSLYTGTPYVAAARIRADYRMDRRWRHHGFVFANTAEGTEWQDFELVNADGKTDESGLFSRNFTIDPDQYYFGEIAIEASVLDAAGRRISSYTEVPWHSRDRFVGLKIEESTVVAGDELDIMSRVIDANEKIISGTEIKIGVYQNTAQARLIEQADWQMIKTCTLLSTEQAVSCPVEITAAGHYKFMASITDTKGRPHQTEIIEYLDPISPEFVYMMEDREQVATLTGPKTATMGEILTLQLESPFTTGKALVTMINNDIIDYQILLIHRKKQTISIPVTQTMFPAFQVRVDILKPRTGILSQQALIEQGIDSHRPRGRTAMHRIDLIAADQNIPITVNSDKKEYRPGDTATLTISNRDRAGETAEFSIVAVDQGLLDLAGDNLPFYNLSPMFRNMAYFLTEIDSANLSLIDQLPGMQVWGVIGIKDLPAPRAPRYLFGMLEEIMVTASLRLPGKETAGEEDFRRDFRNVAYWLPQQVIKGGESREMQFKLPDNLTRWKILVMAVDAGYRYGMAQTDMTVSKPLRIDSVLPHQLLVGDKLNAQFSITNTQQQDVAVAITTKAARAVVPLDKEAIQENVILHPNRIEAVTLAVFAEHEGMGEFIVTAHDHDHANRDAIQLTLPVKSNTVLKRDVIRGQLGDRKEFHHRFTLPSTALPGSARLDIKYSRDGLDLISNAIEFTRDYPHQCWEQRLSRAVGAAFYQQISDKVENIYAWPEAEGTLVQDIINEAGAFQAENGGMVFFIAEDRYSRPYLTAYTLLAFSWLENMGYTIPKHVEQQAATFLKKYFQNESGNYWNWSATMALPLLVKQGDVDISLLDQLLSQLHPDDYDGHVYLYQAMLNTNNQGLLRQYQKPLERVIANGLYFDQGKASLPLVSDTVTACSLITTMLDKPVNASVFNKILHPLVATVRDRVKNKRHWRTTQENVFCAKALLDYQGKTPSLQPVTVKTRINDNSIADIHIDRQQSTGHEFSMDVSEQSNIDLKISAEGSGFVDYSAAVSYEQPADSHQSENQGFCHTA